MTANEQTVSSEGFILVPDTVTDLEHFAANHDEYLVSMYVDPNSASSLWFERRNRGLRGSEGWLSLTYQGQELMNGTLWDEVEGIWFELIDLICQYSQHAHAEALLPGQSVPLRLTDAGGSTLFTIGTQTIRIDPQFFIPGLLDEAMRFYRWVEEYIGTIEPDMFRRIAELRTKRW